MPAWNARARSDDLLFRGRGGSAVRVCGKFMKFGSSLVRVVWHMFPGFTIRCILEQFHFSDCSI